MTKDERIIQYLEFASMEENIPYNTSHKREEWNITDDDVYAYQKKREQEVSLKPTEKRDFVIKKVVKPLLKKHGFTTAGSDWHRDLNDSYIIIHMQNSRWNSMGTGASFRFHISAVKKGEIVNKLSQQWAYNQFSDLHHYHFLPLFGMLSPYYGGDGYQLDGYQNYLPRDASLEDISKQLDEDFGQYVLPELSAVTSYEEFSKLRAEKLERNNEKEIRLLEFYHVAQRTNVHLNEHAFQWLVEMGKNLELRKEDVESHIDWLDIIRNNSSFSKVDRKSIALKAVEE